MPKNITFNIESRDALKKGVDALANAVKVTLGPKGRNVVIGNQYGSPHITKDGVTVAREIHLEDAIENMGAQMVKEVASNTNDAAGDGTTTATVLAQAIMTEGLKNVAAGANPMDVKRGIDKAVKVLVEDVKKQSQSIDDSYEQIEQVATISANNDPVIGELIAHAMKEVKTEGVITVEEAKGTETHVEVVEGMQFDRGYLSPYFVTDSNKMEVVLDNPYILIYDKRISAMAELLPILEKAAKGSQPLLVIADDIDGEALSTLVMNKMRGSLKVAAVKAPLFGERRKDQMEDIAILSGATVITEDRGFTLDTATIEMLGKCEKVVITKDSTTIVNGAGEKSHIHDRIEQTKVIIENTDSPYEKEKIQERLAKLAGGVAVLYVGAPTEVEMREKKDRVDDALAATRAAVEEGIVPGGGVAIVRASAALDSLIVDNKDEQTGINIIRRAVQEPLRQIVENAGLEGSVIASAVLKGKGNYGFNAKSEEFCDMFEAGVIDPTKVVRVGLENAASVAGMLLTTECVISDIPVPQPANGVPMGGMPGMM